MDLSPNDIRNFEFPTQLRGYDKDEVDKFKDQVAEAIEQLKQENLKYSMEMESIKGQLEGLRQFEDAIKSAAIDARRNADLTIANAKKEAELALNKARGEAERIVAAHSKKIAEYETQLTDLKLARNSYVAKFRQLITNHLDMINQVSSESATKSAVKEEEKIDVTDSSEVETKTRETIATPPSEEKAIVTEEAQADEEVAPAEPEAEEARTDTTQTLETAAAPQEAPAEQAPVPEAPIDPELAAALDNYKQGVSEEQAQQAPPAPPPQGEIVETEARADDIPEGFYAKDGVAGEAGSEEGSPEQVSFPVEGQGDEYTEHASLSIDDDAIDAPKSPSLDPDNLARELDNVVAKFEEEMEKAEKS